MKPDRVNEAVARLVIESQQHAARKALLGQGFTEPQADRLIALSVWADRHADEPRDRRAPPEEP